MALLGEASSVPREQQRPGSRELTEPRFWKHRQPRSPGGAALHPACLSLIHLPPVLSGIIGERLPIRHYLTFGMLASGAFTALFGLGYFYNIHSLGFYVVTQVRVGLGAHCAILGSRGDRLGQLR